MRGEFELIDLLRERIAAAGAGSSERLVVGSGDDAAVTAPGGVTATSVDAIVDGVHFRRRTFPPEAIGAKALASALSDLAAMGAAPGEAYVQVGLPDDLGEDELTGIADGLGGIGGRVRRGRSRAATSSPRRSCSSPSRSSGMPTRPSDLVTRAGAQPGDASWS